MDMTVQVTQVFDVHTRMERSNQLQLFVFYNLFAFLLLLFDSNLMLTLFLLL